MRMRTKKDGNAHDILTDDRGRPLATECNQRIRPGAKLLEPEEDTRRCATCRDKVKRGVQRKHVVTPIPNEESERARRRHERRRKRKRRRRRERHERMFPTGRKAEQKKAPEPPPDESRFRRFVRRVFRRGGNR